jgi:hypothetical protein
MNVETEAEATLFPGKEYIIRIAVAVYTVYKYSYHILYSISRIAKDSPLLGKNIALPTKVRRTGRNSAMLESKKARPNF